MIKNEIDIEILNIVHDHSQSDILCYIYSDNNLVDAVTLTEDLYEKAITTLKPNPEQVIQIVAKDLLRSQQIGTVSFPLSLLLLHKAPINLPMSSALTEVIPLDSPKPYLRIQWFCKEPQQKTADFGLENESKALKTAQNELEIEKWKNKGLKQLREEINTSEKARVSAMQRLQSTINDYEEEIAQLKKLIGRNPYEDLASQQKKFEEEFNSVLSDWKRKEKNYIDSISMLEEEKYSQDLEISKLRAQGQVSKLELESFKNLLNVEKTKKDQESQEELQLKVSLLEEDIQEKQREIEVSKKITNEALDQLSYFQVHNAFLRSHIEAIEDRLQEFLRESPPDLEKLIKQHLQTLGINIHVSKITENLFKIEDDTFHLFFDKTDLKIQQGSKTASFIEWVNKFKKSSAHKRSKSEDIKVLQNQSISNQDVLLDTVPEDEMEHEEEPKTKKKVQMKQPQRALQKSPSVKIIRNYNPILRKKKAK